MLAASSGALELVTMLLEFGADINAQDKVDKLPHYLAMIFDRMDQPLLCLHVRKATLKLFKNFYQI